MGGKTGKDTLLWHLSKRKRVKFISAEGFTLFHVSQTIHQGQDLFALGGLDPPQRQEKGKPGLFLLSLVSIRSLEVSGKLRSEPLLLGGAAHRWH